MGAKKELRKRIEQLESSLAFQKKGWEMSTAAWKKVNDHPAIANAHSTDSLCDQTLRALDKVVPRGNA